MNKKIVLFKKIGRSYQPSRQAPPRPHSSRRPLGIARDAPELARHQAWEMEMDGWAACRLIPIQYMGGPFFCFGFSRFQITLTTSWLRIQFLIQVLTMFTCIRSWLRIQFLIQVLTMFTCIQSCRCNGQTRRLEVGSQDDAMKSELQLRRSLTELVCCFRKTTTGWPLRTDLVHEAPTQGGVWGGIIAT